MIKSPKWIKQCFNVGMMKKTYGTNNKDEKSKLELLSEFTSEKSKITEV